MQHQRNQIVPLGIVSLICLLVASWLWAGCTTLRTYPGPVHGLTFNGTIESINLKDHRLTVAPLKLGEPTVFVWESSTKFWKSAVPIRSEPLEPTWTVRVHYHEDSGQLVTHHVYVQTAYPVIH